MGFFLPKDDAVIWRGPMLHKMIDQFLNLVEWGSLDYLIIDLPPGTGDIQLSLCQSIPLTGAVIVSTPQDLAFQVAEKAIIMFKKLKTPVMGIVENMSGFDCSECGHHEDIFGAGGAKRYSEAHQIPFLGSIPLTTQIRSFSDSGKPIVISSPESQEAKAFMKIVDSLKEQLKQRDKTGSDSNEPKDISLESKTELKIVWNDGHTSSYLTYDLRLACPCAQCVDEMTGEKRLVADSIDKKVYAISMEKVGHYALNFQWSDGHGVGIYSYEYLRKLSKK